MTYTSPLRGKTATCRQCQLCYKT